MSARDLIVMGLVLLAGCAHAEPFRRPEMIRWGMSTAEVEAGLEGMCSARVTRPINPPFLRDVRTAQVQVDCEGFQFMGQGRHIEFCIRDNRLVMIWLMVTPAETQSMIDAMTEAYGAPTRRNDNYVAFEGERAAWRFRPAEILFYAPELDADMAPDFD